MHDLTGLLELTRHDKKQFVKIIVQLRQYKILNIMNFHMATQDEKTTICLIVKWGQTHIKCASN